MGAPMIEPMPPRPAVGSPDWFADALTCARRGRPAGFTALYEWLAGPVAGWFRAHGAAEPDDLTSDVFLRAFTALSRSESGSPQGIGAFEGDADGFRSWIFTIAHHRLVDERRRTGRRVVTTERADDGPGSDTPADDDPVTEAMARLGAERVRRLLAALPADQRDVVVMRVLADLSIAQVAAAIGRSEGAVKQLQRRGLLALRDLLEREAATR
jgi:RNA polymerase sigma-70 factor (ECF subfamily)